MPLRHVALFALALVVLASCKKNNGNSAKADPNRLKMYIETDTLNGVPYPPDTSYVTYDNQNRLVSITNNTLKIAYAYQSKTATLDAYQYNKFAEHEIYYLNSAYTIDSTFEYFPFNNPSSPWIVTIDTATEGYRYTGGLLTARLDYSYSSYGNSLPLRNDFTYDNDGNLIKQVESDPYGNVLFITSYTYTSYPVNVNLSPAFAPKQAKYLAATATEITGSGGPMPSETYAYAFDSLGRLTRQTTMVYSGYVTVTTYVYE